MHYRKHAGALLLPVVLLVALQQVSGSASRVVPGIVGRWDMVVGLPGRQYPSWFEITQRGATYMGRFVGVVGSSRPIATVQFAAGRLQFKLPPQFEGGTADQEFTGTLHGNSISGSTLRGNGRVTPWSAVRAPALSVPRRVRWGKPIKLFNGTDLSGWAPRRADQPHGWKVEDGMLTNSAPSQDLRTTSLFRDFKIHIEFMYPADSNSGLYLRGRYEVQIVDEAGKPAESHGPGGVYGFITPTINVATPPGQWQSFDVTLLGRTVTVIYNGHKVIDRAEIPGITGGAIDSNEGEAGPILLQGDHGNITFKNIVLTPAL